MTSPRVGCAGFTDGEGDAHTGRRGKLKRPDGELIEEFVTSTSHVFESGEHRGSVSDHEGDYTGAFWFVHADGRMTRRYTRRTAPKWLLVLYGEVTSWGGERAPVCNHA